MLHTSGFPYAPLGRADVETRAPAGVEAFAPLAAELGARLRLRVPPDVGALGARRDHRPGHRRGLPRFDRGADHGPSASPRVLGDARHHRRSPARRASARRRRPTSSRRCSASASSRSPRVTPEALLGFNGPTCGASAMPGGGGVMRPADLALLYQALLHNPGGIWKPECSPTPPARRPQPPARPLTRVPRTAARTGDRRRRRPVATSAASGTPLAADVRPQRRRRSDRVGRPRQRASRSPTSPTAWTRTSDPPGPARHRTVELRRRLLSRRQTADRRRRGAPAHGRPAPDEHGHASVPDARRRMRDGRRAGGVVVRACEFARATPRAQAAALDQPGESRRGGIVAVGEPEIVLVDQGRPTVADAHVRARRPPHVCPGARPSTPRPVVPVARRPGPPRRPTRALRARIVSSHGVHRDRAALPRHRCSGRSS